uniref:Uncharacterized protein n=1 Tax=Knipowitschia caucasica TaxID=637954 RepID=A0AAV2K7I3_KNICA
MCLGSFFSSNTTPGTRASAPPIHAHTLSQSERRTCTIGPGVEPITADALRAPANHSGAVSSTSVKDEFPCVQLPRLCAQ